MRMDNSGKSIVEISALLQSGGESSEQITQHTLENIANSPLNAFNHVCRAQALEQAKQADVRLSRGEKGALLGVPVAVKDNICTEGVPTTCSSHMLEGYIPPYDAHAVTRLKKAGAVIVGKTNMDEFAMGSSNETSVYGAVKNPVDHNRVSGGSSGGSAAAVSGGLCFAALGSDTGGSIRQPASFCGCVGFKPTYGRISRYGLIAFASSLDQIGVLTRGVEDCAHVYSALAGHDPRDTTSQPLPEQTPDELLSRGIEGLKIGIAPEHFAGGINEEVRQSVLAAINTFEKMGAKTVEVQLSATPVALSAYYIISCAEAASNLARFDGIKYGRRTENFQNLAELYENSRTEALGDEVKRRIMLGNYVLSSGYYDAYYLKALKVRTLIKRDYARAFEKCDLILTPTVPVTAFKLGEKMRNPLEMYMTDVYTVGVNIAGLPAASVPCGKDSDGMPIGLQLIGRPFDESGVLSAAYAFETGEGGKWITK